MKVFLSWSGERSKAVAYLLDDWLQSVIQTLQPWISERDIDRGALWFSEIGDQLQEVKAGIVCVTAENREKPWILFESGALARGLRSQRVITFLVDVEKSEIRPPLSEFNHTQPTKADMWHLVRTLNSLLCDSSLKEGRLNSAFSKYWPDFEERFAKILIDCPVGAPMPARSESDKIDEILQHMRGMDRRIREIEEASPTAKTTYIRPLQAKAPSTTSAAMFSLLKDILDAHSVSTEDTKQLVTRLMSAGLPKNKATALAGLLELTEDSNDALNHYQMMY
ncbi:toll/interleukin-1 receptor domain-containing protein [Luteolibacter flavescens]|uniref:Toll/interleukin-1 receptor domain-containing protein n=1 Tax=Luteolibacter flavescens TaxID=1859460 RepID=A0ABT3FWJ9_9BACT|nr:toll/interleukin-1 receptor domain-containing protein [Luteolibacter flavescens]MCW1887699.1 toll/interleukin-1 receptor domain-containing protein [Luteolibacter flavescens]